MLKKGLKENPQPLKSDKLFQFFGIFDPTFRTLAKVLYSTLPRASVKGK
jgi:hypothetical protein